MFDMFDFVFSHTFWDKTIIVILFLSTMANIYLVGKERQPTTANAAVAAFIINVILIVGLTMTMEQ